MLPINMLNNHHKFTAHYSWWITNERLRCSSKTARESPPNRILSDVAIKVAQTDKPYRNRICAKGVILHLAGIYPTV